ncbi:MAG: DNA-processing protein DprA [Desulfobacula sp.]|nr:DNA-processing protein DprA [Desulfobacula sp.]
MNFLTEDTKAIILLCGILGKKASVKSLSQTEYGRLVRWLIDNNLTPASLLDNKLIKDASSGSKLKENRLEILLGRGTQLGFAVEKWQRDGVWVISRSDSDYPRRYKKHLKEKAPALLFGIGDRAFLNGGGLAMVGSRNVDEKGEAFTKKVAISCSKNKMPVVSGGARGVDQISMETALDAGGTSIGIVADNLLKKSLGKTFRKAIASKRLLLISPFHPGAMFTVWNAMDRNKLIYAMADFALIVSAEHKKGGTWAGATEELKRKDAVPVFCRIDNDAPKGNKKLLDLGAIQWPENCSTLKLNFILKDAATFFYKKQEQNNLTLFDLSCNESIPKKERQDKIVKASSEKHDKKEDKNLLLLSIYEAVLPFILKTLSTPITPADLAEKLDVQKGQMTVWLKKAAEEGKIKKIIKPVRYIRVK